MRRTVGLLIALLLLGLAVLVAIVVRGNEDGDGIGSATTSDIAHQENENAATAQAALDAAVARAVLQAFDDTSESSRRSAERARRELKSIRIASSQAAKAEAARVASRMMQSTFIPRLGFAYGMDLVDDQDRVWTLFDEAIGPGMAIVVESGASSYSKQLAEHQRDLLRSQRQFEAEITRASPIEVPPNAGVLPAQLKNTRMPAAESKIERRVLASIWQRLRTRYPTMLQRGLVRFGVKEAARAPTAVLDGPIPVFETGLILWGLYDAVGSAASAWRAAEREIEAAAVAEVESIANGQQATAEQQLSEAEQQERAARCLALSTALKPLTVKSAAPEYERRCG